MKRISVQEVLGHAEVREAVKKALECQKETGHEHCFIATWDGKQMSVNEVATSGSDSEVNPIQVSRFKGHGYHVSQEGQIVFDFHTHPADNLAFPSTADLVNCGHLQRCNRYQWEVDIDRRRWCNALFGVGTPSQTDITIYQAPTQWVLADQFILCQTVWKAIQDMYERTYGARAKKDRFGNLTDSRLTHIILTHEGFIPPFLAPVDRQRIQRYKKFLDILEFRLVQINETSVPEEPAGGWHTFWVNF